VTNRQFDGHSAALLLRSSGNRISIDTLSSPHAVVSSVATRPRGFLLLLHQRPTALYRPLSASTFGFGGRKAAGPHERQTTCRRDKPADAADKPMCRETLSATLCRDEAVNVPHLGSEMAHL